MTDDRAKSLIITYKCSGYKITCFDHDRYVGSTPTSHVKIRVPVQVSRSVFNSKIRVEVAIEHLENCSFYNQTRREPHSCKETQNAIPTETRRTKLTRTR